MSALLALPKTWTSDYLESMMQGSGEIIVSACGPNETSARATKLWSWAIYLPTYEFLREKKALKSSFDTTR